MKTTRFVLSGVLFILAFMFLQPCSAEEPIKRSKRSIRCIRSIDYYRILGLKYSNDRWIAKDKYQHVVASAFLMGVSYNILRTEGKCSQTKAMVCSCSFSFSIGIFKEWWDARHPNHVASIKDLVVNMVGIGIGILCFSDNLTF